MQVAPEDMEAAASMAVKDKYVVFGGLDGWITLLEALEPSKYVYVCSYIYTPV